MLCRSCKNRGKEEGKFFILQVFPERNKKKVKERNGKEVGKGAHRKKGARKNGWKNEN